MSEPRALALGDYEGEESRYAIYSLRRDAPAYPPEERSRLAETSLDGIGVTIRTLREDGDVSDDTRVGVFDRLTRDWLVNPWAKGDLR
jgi:hypothetical protein